MSEPHAPPREKDDWDKASIVGQVLVPIMLAALTTVYSCQESAQRKVEAQQAAAERRSEAQEITRLQIENTKPQR